MNMEFNKLFAAVLVAGITAYMGGFVAKKLVHPVDLAEDAFPVEGIASAPSGAAGPTGPEPILAMIASADLARGESLSRACAACHTFNEGGADGTGPHMWGVVGRAKGSVSGFAYSKDIAEKGGAWDYDSLNAFLWKPKTYAPGTKMNFIGIKKPEERAAMIAYLRSLSKNPPALPSAAQIAAEQAALAPSDDGDVAVE